MNPLLDDATTRQKLKAMAFLAIRVGMGVVAWFCFKGIGDSFVQASKGSVSSAARDSLMLGLIIGAVLMYKYLEDLVFVSRHGFNVSRWFGTGLRRPWQRFLPNLIGTFTGFNIGEVVQGKYWKLLTILPWAMVWVALAAGCSPVLQRVRSVRRKKLFAGEARNIERMMRDEEEL